MEIILPSSNGHFKIDIFSRQAATISQIIKKRIKLEDLGGKNGPRVNRIAVGRKVLSDGDRIHIGRAELVFET